MLNWGHNLNVLRSRLIMIEWMRVKPIIPYVLQPFMVLNINCNLFSCFGVSWLYAAVSVSNILAKHSRAELPMRYWRQLHLRATPSLRGRDPVESVKMTFDDFVLRNLQTVLGGLRFESFMQRSRSVSQIRKPHEGHSALEVFNNLPVKKYSISLFAAFDRRLYSW